MQKTSPLLTLVIPTRNRQDCISSVLKAIAKHYADELEVIVHDNSEMPSLRKVITSLNDPRIHYYYTTDKMNMHQNFDRAIAKATGEYVCAIGDDDGIVISAALEALRNAKRMGAEAVLSERIFYAWPGVKHRMWGDSGGAAREENLFNGMKEQILTPEASLSELFECGSLDGLGTLPRVYHGYVARTALDRLFNECGTYFPGGSPDMANAAALSGIVAKVLMVPEITNITGHSPKSGGGEGAAGIHHSELSRANHLPEETISNWTPGIPRFWSGVTIYAQSAIEGSKATGVVPAASFNFAKLCAACLIYQPKEYRPHIFAAMRIVGQKKPRMWARFYGNIAKLSFQRASLFLRNILEYRFERGVIGKFENVGELMTYLDQE